MPLTTRSRVHYTLFAPFAPHLVHHCAGPLRLADGALLGASLLTTQPPIRRGGRRFGRRQRDPTLRTCSVRFRDARSRVDDATSMVKLRRVQRSRLGHDRERFHRRDNSIFIR